MNEIKLNEMQTNETKKAIMQFIVNNLGINLCSVRDIYISKQKDGQLKNIQITFNPSEMSANQKIVMDWQAKNPNGTKMECHRDTGVSRPTINKYWVDMRGDLG